MVQRVGKYLGDMIRRQRSFLTDMKNNLQDFLVETRLSVAITGPPARTVPGVVTFNAENKPVKCCLGKARREAHPPDRASPRSVCNAGLPGSARTDFPSRFWVSGGAKPDARLPARLWRLARGATVLHRQNHE